MFGKFYFNFEFKLLLLLQGETFVKAGAKMFVISKLVYLSLPKPGVLGGGHMAHSMYFFPAPP